MEFDSLVVCTCDRIVIGVYYDIRVEVGMRVNRDILKILFFISIWGT